MKKEELIKQIKEYQTTKNRNPMGCSENWYSLAYAFKETFTIDEIEKMSQNEIDKLCKLAGNVMDGLY